MSSGQSYQFQKASKAAGYIADLLRPHCVQLHIAGSIRRMRSEVSDIEIVCQPKKEFIQTGLFAEIGEWGIHKDFSEALATIVDIVIKGNVNGRYMQIKTNSKSCPGIYLDLFMPQPEDYYRQYAIRTGSSDYAHNVIAATWKKLGWVGTHDGLRIREECEETPSGWKCIAEKPTLPPVWKSEGEFFVWLGLDYIDPELRDAKKTIDESR